MINLQFRVTDFGVRLTVVLLPCVASSVPDLKGFQLAPSFDTLRERLNEIYVHSKEEVSYIANKLFEVMPSWNGGGMPEEVTSPPPTPAPTPSAAGGK
jgi:hypothetical protein